MWYCEDCGAVFGEALPTMEYWGECHGRPVYAPLYICPVCGGALCRGEHCSPVVGTW